MLFFNYCRIWQVKFLLISQIAKIITLNVFQKSMVAVLGLARHTELQSNILQWEKVPNIPFLLVNNELITKLDTKCIY